MGFGTTPTFTPEGLRPQPFAVRLFVASTADGYTVMPGGLAMAVALFLGLAAGTLLMVRMLVSMPAQVAAGSAGWPVRQGTGVPPRAAKPLMIAC